MGLMKSCKNYRAEHSGNEELAAVHNEAILHTEVAPRSPKFFQVGREVTLVVRESRLNKLNEVLVLAVIVGMVMELLKTKVAFMLGSKLGRLEASDR